MTVVSVIHRWR